MTVIAADVRLDGDVPFTTHVHGDRGVWVEVFPLGTDPEGRPLLRLALGGPYHAQPRDVPVTEDELRAGLLAVFGSRVRLLERRYASRT